MSEIKDYYLIGDLHSAALISKNASIDWLCLPHFDSPSLFAKLLDAKAGSFSVDTSGYSVSSDYLKDTAILEFTFKNTHSEFKIRDFMVPLPQSKTENHFLVRKFTGVKGKSDTKLIFNPKPNYAQKKPALKFDHQKLDLKAQAQEDLILLHPPKGAVFIESQNGYEVSFSIAEGDQVSLVLEYISASHKPIYHGQDFEGQTIKFWHDWVGKGHFFDFCRDKLVRSAITLKLMQFYPTGAIVASPTTSLPENIGGERNWDYRYVWIRDATFTLYAFYVLGYLEEAEKFFEFIQQVLEKSSKKDFDISLMYTIDGSAVPKEKTLPHLSGFKNSQPVRIGNGARDQFQLDVYGALIDAYYFVSKRKMKIHDLAKNLLLSLVKKIEQTWQKKDSGIWEVRSGVQDFTYSKVMAWVGVNRVLRMSKKLNLSRGEINRLQILEKQIHNWIWKNCFDPVTKTFRQHPLSKRQDATNLLFVLLQFLDKHDPLTKTIIEKTCLELSFKDVFVYRYFTEDGLRGREGAFLLCSFWLISAWAILEEVKIASGLFNKFEQFMDDSGLLSEEMDPDSGEYLGNFPQAFSHIGYIMSAYYINRYGLKNNLLN